MIRLMNLLILSCRTATELMEKAQTTRLNVFERLRLSLHSKICEGCQRYENQKHIIDDVLKRRSTTQPLSISLSKKLPEEVKLKIYKALGEQ